VLKATTAAGPCTPPKSYCGRSSRDRLQLKRPRQHFIDHFAGILNHRQAAVLGAIAEQCWDRGHCALSIDAIADEALVSRRTIYNALRSARGRNGSVPPRKFLGLDERD
jgi:hypothetical protein